MQSLQYSSRLGGPLLTQQHMAFRLRPRLPTRTSDHPEPAAFVSVHLKVRRFLGTRDPLRVGTGSMRMPPGYRAPNGSGERPNEASGRMAGTRAPARSGIVRRRAEAEKEARCIPTISDLFSFAFLH